MNIYEKLNSYDNITLKTNVDDEINNIDLVIKYNDHGDDFLLVRSNGNIYEYGYWLNRYGYPSYSELHNSNYDFGFVRKPELYYDYDERSSFSNEIYKHAKQNFIDDSSFDSDKVRKCITAYNAQGYFDDFIEYMNSYVPSRKIIYNFIYSTIKDDIIDFLKLNEIYTDENIEKFSNIKWTSKIDGFDGIAGKRKTEIDVLYCDDILIVSQIFISIGLILKGE